MPPYFLIYIFPDSLLRLQDGKQISRQRQNTTTSKSTSFHAGALCKTQLPYFYTSYLFVLHKVGPTAKGPASAFGQGLKDLWKCKVLMYFGLEISPLGKRQVFGSIVLVLAA
ncbi:hypothetical protein J3458_013468 [Metarhizium acridum]|uniref:uncharacterized protein n=1 Tax=Metarhizium acridum TaxID=92637 RepID=UPI001C6BDA6E|nr:hypothetical protein J3458_013468 [Metarhizium acridum]